MRLFPSDSPNGPFGLEPCPSESPSPSPIQRRRGLRRAGRAPAWRLSPSRNSALSSTFASTDSSEEPEILDNAQINNKRSEDLALWISEYDRLRRAISQLKCQIKTLQQHPAKAATQILRRMERELVRLTKSQQQVHQHIEQLTKTQENAQRIASIKGIGPLTAAALANRIGPIQRFASADKLKAYLGLYPAQRQAGQRKTLTRLAKHGDKLIRHLMWNCAKSTARHNPACKQLFERLIHKGYRMVSAWAAVMRKLVQIVYGVLKHQSHWMPEYHSSGIAPKPRGI